VGPQKGKKVFTLQTLPAMQEGAESGTLPGNVAALVPAPSYSLPWCIRAKQQSSCSHYHQAAGKSD